MVFVRVWDVAVVVAAAWLGGCERRNGQKENEPKQALRASLVPPSTSSLVDEPFGSSRLVAPELAPRICLSKSH